MCLLGHLDLYFDERVEAEGGCQGVHANQQVRDFDISAVTQRLGERWREGCEQHKANGQNCQVRAHQPIGSLAEPGKVAGALVASVEHGPDQAQEQARRLVLLDVFSEPVDNRVGGNCLGAEEHRDE